MWRLGEQGGREMGDWRGRGGVWRAAVLGARRAGEVKSDGPGLGWLSSWDRFSKLMPAPLLPPSALRCKQYGLCLEASKDEDEEGLSIVSYSENLRSPSFPSWER